MKDIQKKFIGTKPCCGYIPDHIYDITIEPDTDDSRYVITADFDITDNKEVDLYIRLSSENSYRNYFQ